MAKRSRRPTTTSTPVRGAVATATRSVQPVINNYRPLVLSYLRLLEDRRYFHPDKPFTLPAASPRSAVRMVIRDKRKNVSRLSRPVKFVEYPPQYVGVHQPNRVAICVRRKTRRQVIFASGVGGTKVRRGKRSYASGFHC